MDNTQNDRRPDRSNHPSGRTYSGLSGGDRFTVDSMERQMQQSRRQRSRRRRRSRSRGSHSDESRAGRNVWIAVLIVALLYVGFLVLSRASGKDSQGKRASNTAKTAAETAKEKSPVQAAAVVSANGVAAGKAEELIPTIKKAAKLSDDGRKLMRARQWMGAEAKLREALVLTPDSITLLIDLANVLIEQQKWADARSLLYRAISIAPETVAVRLALARVSVELGEDQDAMALAEWIVESEPYSEPAHQMIAEIATKLEQYEKSVVHWQKLVSLNSNNHVAENNLGVSYLRLKQTAQALKSFENVLRDEPANSQAHYYMALCFIQKNEPELAVDVLSRAIDRFGYPFVYSWSRGNEFDALKDLPSFKRLFESVPAGDGQAPPG